MAISLANTPLINYFRYKQSTTISEASGLPPLPVLSIADGGNGQLVITTSTTTNVSSGVAVSLSGMSLSEYDGNYSVLSFTATTFNVSGVFTATATGTWEFASALSEGVAGEPLDFGTIQFLDADNKTTLQDTFSDRKLTIPNTNPIVLDSVGSVPPIYLQDIPYYIEIRDKFNNLIASIDDYSPDGDEEAQDTSNITNLFSSYGFDSIVDVGNYSEISLPKDTPNNAVSSGWFWEIFTTNNNEKNTYTFDELLSSGLEGNPKNEFILSTTGNSAGNSTNNIRCTIGDYQSFQGKIITVSIYTRQVSGSISEIPVLLRRSEGGVNQTPVSVGTIAVSPTRQQQKLSFTVPILAAGVYVNSDVLDFVLQLPLNSDFSLGLTGMWAQFSDIEEEEPLVEIAEPTAGQSQAFQYFGNAFRQLQSQNMAQFIGLPTTLDGTGGVGILQNTGVIFIGKDTYLFAEPLDDDAIYLRDKVLLGQISANRLIDYMREMGITRSRNTLIALQNVADVLVSPGIGALQQAMPVANAGGRVTISNTNPVQQYGIYANINEDQTNVVRITFNDFFNAQVDPFAPVYAFTNFPVYEPTAATKNNVIVNWFGMSSYFYSVVTTPTGVLGFSPYFECGTLTSGGATTNATARISFTDNDPEVFKSLILTPLLENMEILEYPYKNTDFYVGDSSNSNINSTVKCNYFAYNDSSDNPNPQPDPPPRVIRYSVDGDKGKDSPNGTISTLIIDIDKGDRAQEIALKSMMAINEPWEETITIVSIPQNGDYVTLPLEDDEFVVVFWDAAQAKPGNPLPADFPVYVKYNLADSLIEIAEKTVAAINASHIGLPLWQDLGLPEVSHNSSGLKYYITN